MLCACLSELGLWSPRRAALHRPRQGAQPLALRFTYMAVFTPDGLLRPKSSFLIFLRLRCAFSALGLDLNALPVLLPGVFVPPWSFPTAHRLCPCRVCPLVPVPPACLPDFLPLDLRPCPFALSRERFLLWPLRSVLGVLGSTGSAPPPPPSSASWLCCLFSQPLRLHLKSPLAIMFVQSKAVASSLGPSPSVVTVGPLSSSPPWGHG